MGKCVCIAVHAALNLKVKEEQNFDKREGWDERQRGGLVGRPGALLVRADGVHEPGVMCAHAN